ncbi:MAG TPA: hypothetical protein VLM39_05705 [Ignavibacteriaceae bacterium]|nr:hypothetical protein [Ignavibacteriaceae bacterium]
MNNKDKIILYLDNLLNPQEREKFEEDLKNSPELRLELESYKKVLENLKLMNIQSAGESYFINNIPLFREKLEKKKKVWIQKKIIYASSGLVIVLLVLSLFLFRNAETIPNNGKNLELTQEQIKSLTDSYANLEIDGALNNVADSVWNELLSDELNFSYETADSILHAFNGNVDYNEGLNDEEASLIYDRLITKESF